MDQLTVSGDDRLELEAFKALSGADYAQRRLLHGLSMGTPSIENEVYLIKSRIKGVDSLVTKVLERYNNNESYSALSVRDIVGLRLLTLFKNELPYLCSRFLQFVEWSQKEPFSLFYGTTVHDAVEEIKIYATADVTDPNPELYATEFASYGFQLNEPDPETGACPVFIDRKPSQYSSIHIVLWANGPNRSLQDRVPVEVQLRTSLEDVWGEIDHRLRYKARSAGRRRTGSSSTSSEKAAEAELFNHLKILKRNLDNSSEIADLIERRIKTEDFVEGSIAFYKRDVSFDIFQMDRVCSPSEFREEVAEAAARLVNIYNAIQDLEPLPKTKVIDGLIEELEESAETLRLLWDRVKGALPQARKTEAFYRIMMERALCFYWAALLYRARARRGNNERAALRSIKEAISQYVEVGLIEELSRRPVVSFRLASVLRERGEFEYALQKMEEAVDYLRSDTILPDDHYMRIRIPREYAFSLWEAAERTKRKSYELGEASFLLASRRDQYLKALTVTSQIYGQEVRLGSHDRDFTNTALEKRVTANNILEYALCYLKSKGEPAELIKLGITKERLLSYLKELVGGGLEEIDRVTRVDTVRETARALGDRELAVAAAQRVLNMIGTHDSSVALPDIAYEEMRRDAEAEIQTGLEQGGSYAVEW